MTPAATPNKLPLSLFVIMAVRLKTTKLVYVDLKDLEEDSEEEVLSIRHPSPQPRSKPKENFKHWLVQKSEKSAAKWKDKRNFFFYLVIFIFLLATGGLALALKDGRQEISGLIILASVLSLLLIYVTFVQFKRSCVKQEIKVSRVYNQTNADGYIDIDY